MNSDKNTLVYIGPTIPGVAYNGTAYTDGLPDAFEEIIKEIPALRRLLVHPSELPKCLEQVRLKNSRLHLFYEIVQEQVQKGVK
ncbi:MAG: hypothetical protein ACI4JC_01085 [Faecalibacterium sp.]